MCKFVGDVLAGRVQLPPEKAKYFDRKFAEEWVSEDVSGHQVAKNPAWDTEQRVPILGAWRTCLLRGHQNPGVWYWPVDQQRLPDDEFLLQRSKRAAVLAIVAVISHHEN